MLAFQSPDSKTRRGTGSRQMIYYLLLTIDYCVGRAVIAKERTDCGNLDCYDRTCYRLA